MPGDRFVRRSMLVETVPGVKSTPLRCGVFGLGRGVCASIGPHGLVVSWFVVPLMKSPAMPAGSDPSVYTISDLAREFALTTRAIRFYEDEGLVSPHRSGRSRVYAERDRVRIKLILRGKRLGLSLTEIRELLDLYDVSRSERPQLIKFLEMLAARRSMLKQQQEDIAIVLAEIDSLERQCRKRLRQTAGGT